VEGKRSLKIFGVALLLVCAALMLQRVRSGPESVSITVGDRVIFKRTKCKPGQDKVGDSCTYPDEPAGRLTNNPTGEDHKVL
jgi:hypothetical protein